MILLFACGCAKGGEGSCFMRQRVDDHSIISCAETPDLSSEEYSRQEDACQSLPGRDAYVSGEFKNELCPRAGIVAGCDLGEGRRLWYYPNETGYPTVADMQLLCSRMTVVPAP
jgi:hypothetical protein